MRNAGLQAFTQDVFPFFNPMFPVITLAVSEPLRRNLCPGFRHSRRFQDHFPHAFKERKPASRFDDIFDHHGRNIGIGAPFLLQQAFRIKQRLQRGLPVRAGVQTHRRTDRHREGHQFLHSPFLQPAESRIVKANGPAEIQQALFLHFHGAQARKQLRHAGQVEHALCIGFAVHRGFGPFAVAAGYGKAAQDFRFPGEKADAVCERHFSTPIRVHATRPSARSGR